MFWRRFGTAALAVAWLGTAVALAGLLGAISDPRGDSKGPASKDLRSGTAAYDNMTGWTHTVTVQGKANAKSPPVLYFNDPVGGADPGGPEYAAARVLGHDVLVHLPSFPTSIEGALIEKTGPRTFTFGMPLCLGDYEWRIAYQDGDRVLDRAPDSGYVPFEIPPGKAKRC